MRGGGDGSTRNGGSSSAPQLPRGGSTGMASDCFSNGDPTTVGNNTSSFFQGEREGRGDLSESSETTGSKATGPAGGIVQEAANEEEAQAAARLLQQLKSRNQEIESRRRQLEHRCTQLEAEASSKHAELQSYKAEVRAKTIAVGKAEIILNDVCLSMARRVGRAEGVQVAESKGRVLLEVHETPAEFAAQIKKNILAQLTKWEIDRAALQASAASAGGKAADAAKVHEAERAGLLERVEHLEARIREMKVDSDRQRTEAKAFAQRSRKECEEAAAAKDALLGRLEVEASQNKELRKSVEDNEKQFQVLTLRRQLAVTGAGMAGSASTRKAVIEGTVDRLQRAETAARHQAIKYKDLAGARGVQLAQLETEVSSLKASNKNLRRMLETPANDSYETEIARLARSNPEVLEIQQRSGLTREDMEASMAQLKLLREKEEQKDALIGLARERDEFELCVKELRARNSWLEKQVLGSPGALRSVAEERVKAVAESEEAELSRGAESRANGGWTGTKTRYSNGASKDDPVSRLERRLEVRQGRGRGHGRGGPDVKEEGRIAGGALTATIRRNIQFLEDCDRYWRRYAHLAHTFNLYFREQALWRGQ
eukprot:g7920.t1